MDSIGKINFSKKHLLRAKQENDNIKIADSYYFFSEIYIDEKKAVQYADSIIKLTAHLNHFRYPALGYIEKGIHNYYNKNNEEALRYFLKANDLALKNKNEIQIITVRHYIGLLKSINNKTEESLKIFKDNYNYIKEKKLDTVHKKQYFKSLFALSNCYAKNDLFNEAEKYYRKGLKESTNNTEFLYAYFLTGLGVCNYENNNYEQAIDSLKKGCKLLKSDKINLSAMYLYIFESYDAINNSNQGLNYLFKIDSIYKENNSVRKYARHAHNYLYEYYKKINNKEEQLKYLSKFIEVDSLIKAKDGDLDTEILKKYDTPKLIEEKQELINSLKKENSSTKNNMTYLFTLSILVFLCLVYFLRRNYILNKRFKLIIEKTKANDNVEDKNTLLETDPLLELKSIGISEDLIDKILQKLNKFEKSERFTKKKYTLNSLAKEINTNSSYLSKVINYNKNTNFANYINNLRIDYAVDRLTKDARFRKFTIKAISEESGFNSNQTFSIAFQKRTKLKPSYFIKQLEKK